MHIVAHVGPQHASRLRAALRESDVLLEVSSQAGVVEFRGLERADAIVIDPCCACCAAETHPSPIVLRAAMRGRPLIVYTSLTAPAVRAIARLTSTLLVHVILFEIDDVPAELRRLLDRVSSAAVGAHVLRRIAPALRRLPHRIEATIRDLYLREAPVASVAGLARLAETTERSLERWMARAGLASPKLILSGALLVRAYSDIAFSSASISAVARRCGLGSARALNAHARAVLALTPSRLRSSMPPEKFAHAVARRLWLGSSVRESAPSIQPWARNRSLATRIQSVR